MTAKEIYEKEFAYYVECLEDRDIYEWAADRIFDLTTYDGSLDKLFVRTILGICGVILNRQTYAFIKDDNMYVVYIVVCQLLKKKSWINWGTSIRGAWFENGRDAKPIYESYDGSVSVPFTEKNLIALIEFIEEHEPKEEEENNDKT